MKFIYTSILCCLFFTTFGQNYNPVSWTIAVDTTDQEDIYKVIATATIEKDWVIYSKETEDDGPIPTAFTIAESDQFELIDEYIESKEPHTAFSDLFEINVSKFDTEVSLIQTIKLSGDSAEINASVVFMTCSGDRCLPPNEVILQTKI